MTKTEVCARLRERGATRVEIEFSGGTDEFGADAISLYAGEQRIGELPTWRRQGVTDPNTVLVEALSAPIHDRWGAVEGDFTVHGTLTWDVQSETVRISGAASVSEPFDEEVTRR